ncbi:MAG: type II/IV secretion system protein [Patescibacteria group bacterium]|nr:GspE/PulE family protein [Patescibacteria group bacterium]MDE1941045.1 type II/IV secretion system protein [Patescibacteria group bacterium]MDE1966541.1 type II/IV secretion system protein [Patescibacteria group bacterium]
MFVEDAQLYKFILDSGLVTHEDLDSAKAESEKKNKRLGDVLVKAGKITADNLRRMQAYVLGIPFVDLKNKKIPFETLSLIPEPIARSHNIVAFKKTDLTLEVAMLDVNDLSAIDFIKKKVNLKILPRLTDTDSIKEVLVQYQKSLKAEFGDIIQKETETLKMLSEEKGEAASEADLKKIAEDLPVVRIVDTLIKHAILQNASDIHIEPMEDQVLVRYRIDGLLHDAMVLPRQAGPSVSARIKVLSNLKLDEKRLPQDGRFKVDMSDEKVSFRVSILPTYYGEKIVMRLLRDAISGYTLEFLTFHGETLERIHWALKQDTGMILTTGPTGSGKTTTLYTMLDILNTPDVNISTIEDPIEYQMPRINQTNVRPEIGFTFAQGIRTLVRQDPDIIMVGEIRDDETAALAVNAALTGHLVLSTLHTNSAAGAIPRLLDMKVEPFLLASTIDIVIGQRLVRRLTDSREKYTLSKAELAQLEKLGDLSRVLEALKAEKIIKSGDGWADIPFWKPVAAGDNDGFKGRSGVHEVLKMSPAIRDLIMKNATSAQIEDQAKKEGMLTMLEDGIFKCAAGITTIEEVLRVVSE